MTFKITLISSGQPSLNPRLVKEADALANAGYQVTVLYAYWNNWGTTFDEQLLKTKKWKAIRVGGDPLQKPITYFFSRLIHKTAKLIVQKLRVTGLLAELAVTRSSYFLMRQATKHPADLYIGHNLGALAATVKAAKKHHARCGFDAEDFHRQEVSDDTNSFNFKITKYLEDKYLNEVDYLTTSSPEITKVYRQLYSRQIPLTILNVFPRNTAVKQRSNNTTGPIKILWFSQTIGSNRGIEDIVQALKLLNNKSFELHLLGHLPAENKQVFVQTILQGINVVFHKPVHPDDLINFASQFDIGLASEKSAPFNRDICLTNKLFTYIQAGLAIIASNTTAQKYFMQRHRQIGKVYVKNNPQSLAGCLSMFELNRGLLCDSCRESLKLGNEILNWENEGQKFLALIKNTLIKN